MVTGKYIPSPDLICLFHHNRFTFYCDGDWKTGFSVKHENLSVFFDSWISHMLSKQIQWMQVLYRHTFLCFISSHETKIIVFFAIFNFYIVKSLKCVVWKWHNCIIACQTCLTWHWLIRESDDDPLSGRVAWLMKMDFHLIKNRQPKWIAHVESCS